MLSLPGSAMHRTQSRRSILVLLLAPVIAHVGAAQSTVRAWGQQ
jgi:hypothetical protein